MRGVGQLPRRSDIPVRSGFRVTYLILPLYVIAAVIFTWPTLRHFSTAIPSNGALDPCMQAFLIGWDAQSLLPNPLSLFHAPIFFPESNTLTYMDHLIGETLTAGPAFLFFQSIAAAYNFLFLGSFAVSGWATYRLTRLLGVSRPGAFLSGLLFAFSPYRFGNLDLLNQLQTQFLPLGLLFGLRYLRRFRARDACGVAGVLVLQTYFGWYYTFYLVIALGLLILYAVLTGALHRFRLRPRTLAVIAVASSLLVAPVVLPYVLQHRSLPEFHRTLGESALYSADVFDYLKLNKNAVVAEAAPLPVGAQPYWPGLTTVLLATFGVMETWRRRSADAMYFALLTGTSYILSLGPILHVAGARIWIPLPYAALYYVIPGFSGMRAPARLAVLVVLGASVLAGLGYCSVRDRLRHRFALWRSIVVSAFALTILSAWPKPLSTVELPSRNRLPPVYAWLAKHYGGDPLLELPVPARDADENETQSLRQFYVLFHGHPRLDGTSGFVSLRYRNFRSAVQTFPREDALRAASQMGAKVIVIHYGDYPDRQRESLRQAVVGERSLALVAEFNNDAVYVLHDPSRR
jgi:hypothetical protein